MKRSEKLAYLKDNHLDIFLKTRQKVLTNYLTNRQLNLKLILEF